MSGPRGNPVLKIKGKPKMLQDWQAYQLLTYDKQWKSQVDKEWETYKTEWEAEHPDEKGPPKNRFQIMVEFIKEKYKNETDEMKARCEEYRQERKASPDLSDSEGTRNLEWQL